MDLHAITVFTTLDGRPCNKVITRAPDGSIVRKRAKSGRYTARTVPATLATLAEQLRAVSARPDQMISLSLFVDPPPVDEWQVWPCWELAEALGCKKTEKERLAGFHWIKGGWVVARIKESMTLSAFLLFDRDMSEGMPAALAEMEVADWRRGTALLFPGADTCGCVILPSTSNRIVIDGVRQTSRSCHMIVEVDDPDLIEGAWDQAVHRSLITLYAPTPWDDEIALAFPKPVRDRKHGTGAVLRQSWWTIFDRSTWSIAREVFDGAPKSEAAGIVIAPPEVILHEGPVLELTRVKDLTKVELTMVADAVREITGYKPTMKATKRIGKDGKAHVCSLSVQITDLEYDLEVESEDGWTTVRALHNSGVTHARLQSPFRDSTSWAAFYGIHNDGTPFVFDMGTGEKHVLIRTGLKHIWEHLADWLVEEFRPGFRCQDRDTAIFSIEQGRRLTMRDVKPAPGILRLLRMASNTPMDKGGIKENALPAEFNKWLPFAWSFVLTSLPMEDETGIIEAAGVEFKGHLERLLKAHVQSDDGGRWLKRALGTWCHYYALLTPGEWRQVGTYDAWGRILDDGSFQIAITYNLAAQVSRVGHSELAALNNQALSKLCRRYGIMANVGDNRVSIDGRQIRVTVLTSEFILECALSTNHDDPLSAGLRAASDDDPSIRSIEGSKPTKH